MRLEILDRLSEPDREAWDSLALGRSFYAGTGWLAFQEELEDGGHVYHVCVRSGGRLVAAVAVFVVRQPSSRNYDPKRLFGDLADPIVQPVALIGSSRGFYSGPLVDTDEYERALDLLVEGVQRIVDEHCGGLAWWLYTSTADSVEIASRYGVVPRLLNGECVIYMEGNGFEDYLASLSSSRRGDVRRDLRAFEASGLQLEEKRLSDCYEQCGELLAATQRKHGLTVSADDMSAWLEKLCRTSADSGQVYLCRSSEQVIGFSLSYTFGETIYLRAVGFDYVRAPHSAEYFELLFYKPIRNAYAQGANALHLGAGSYSAKVRRGALVRPMWAVPSKPDAWDSSKTKAYNAEHVANLVSELPRGEDLVWTDDSRSWL